MSLKRLWLHLSVVVLVLVSSRSELYPQAIVSYVGRIRMDSRPEAKRALWSSIGVLGLSVHRGGSHLLRCSLVHRSVAVDQEEAKFDEFSPGKGCESASRNLS